MKWFKRILFTIITLLVILVLLAFLYMKNDASNPYEKPSPIPVEVPSFETVEINFEHQFNSKNHLPVAGAAIIDIDNDGIPELWFGGGRNQDDAIFKYESGKFVDISKTAGIQDKPAESQSYGPTCYDLDNDGDSDMLITRDDGVYFYENNNGKFKSSKLNLKFDDKSTPIAVTCGDINGDGHIDLFVSTYLPKSKMEGQTIFLKDGYGSNSLLFANRGNMKFEDITDASGLRYTHNTFLGVFIDVDDDHLLDLVVAHDTGEPRTYKNLGQEKFKMMPNPLTGKFSYPMGIAIGDYNQDGKADFFFSNTGSTLPSAILKGDLDLSKHTFFSKWILLSNQGNFSFKETGEETNIADFEFSWGAIFEDFNLDGLQDLVVAENYVDLPLFNLHKLPCRFLLNTPDHKFISTESESGVVNKNFGISPLTADFNNDGYPDLIYSNIAGKPKAFINKGGKNSFLKVKLEESSKALGAKVVLTKANGKDLTDWLITGEGLGSDQSHILVFGLGTDTEVKNVRVVYSDGTTKDVANPVINETLYISTENNMLDDTDNNGG